MVTSSEDVFCNLGIQLSRASTPQRVHTLPETDTCGSRALTHRTIEPGSTDPLAVIHRYPFLKDVRTSSAGISLALQPGADLGLCGLGLELVRKILGLLRFARRLALQSRVLLVKARCLDSHSQRTTTIGTSFRATAGGSAQL